MLPKMYHLYFEMKFQVNGLNISEIYFLSIPWLKCTNKKEVDFNSYMLHKLLRIPNINAIKEALLEKKFMH